MAVEGPALAFTSDIASQTQAHITSIAVEGPALAFTSDIASPTPHKRRHTRHPSQSKQRISPTPIRDLGDSTPRFVMVWMRLAIHHLRGPDGFLAPPVWRDRFLDIEQADDGLQDSRRHEVLERHLIPKDSVELPPIFAESDVTPKVARLSVAAAVDDRGAQNVYARPVTED
jgi:hypothetical protein